MFLFSSNFPVLHVSRFLPFWFFFLGLGGLGLASRRRGWPCLLGKVLAIFGAGVAPSFSSLGLSGCPSLPWSLPSPKGSPLPLQNVSPNCFPSPPLPPQRFLSSSSPKGFPLSPPPPPPPTGCRVVSPPSPPGVVSPPSPPTVVSLLPRVSCHLPHPPSLPKPYHVWGEGVRT